MFSSLVDMVNDLALGPHTRKVRKYLDQATCDSVSGDLGKVLSSQLTGVRERELLQATFNKYCIEDASQQKYWNEESFSKYIRSTHSDAVISGPAIRLLWRSFHFYAHHPFPRHHQHGKVNFDAFQRAALLQVFQCNDLLGTRELDWFWRNDAAFFHRASFARIFRSIGVAEATTPTEPLEQQEDLDSAVNDAMDVLIMVGPQFMHAAPSPNQLEGVARKLFTGGSAVAKRQVMPQDVSTLLHLLLRLRLKKKKWGYFYHFGDFAEADAADEAMTAALVNILVGDESKRTVAPEQLVEAMDLIPNLELRFYQLWAVLFQPSVATAEAKVPGTPPAVPTHISGAISLFAPRLMTENRYFRRTTQQDARLVLEKAENMPDLESTTISRLVQALSRNLGAYVVLFAGDTVATTAETVIGAYLPGPLHAFGAEVRNGKHEARGDTSPLLFQLQPEFRLLWWTRPDVPLTDLIRPESEKVSLDAAITEGSGSLHVPYWIGNSMSQGAGLRIDPEKDVAKLTTGAKGWYRDVKIGRNKESGDNWEVIIQNARMDILAVKGGVDNRS